MVNGDEPRDDIVGEFLAMRGAYEAETGASPIKPYVAPDPVMAAAVAAAAPLVLPPNPDSAPPTNFVPVTAAPGLSGRLPNGTLHPTKTCAVCDQPMKAVDGVTKSGPNAGKPYYKLACSNDWDHKPQDWSQNYRDGR